MRRATTLLTRLLLALALIVAAWPVRASAASCAFSLPSGGEGQGVRGRCVMPCCAKRVKACCAGKKAVAANPCDCEMRSAPAVPALTKEALPAPFVAAFPTRRLFLSSTRLDEFTPGVVGLDAGPPPDPPHLGDASRAPPVVRA